MAIEIDKNNSRVVKSYLFNETLESMIVKRNKKFSSYMHQYKKGHVLGTNIQTQDISDSDLDIVNAISKINIHPEQEDEIKNKLATKDKYGAAKLGKLEEIMKR